MGKGFNFGGVVMEVIVAMVLAGMEADRAVAAAVKDSSCVECRKFEDSVSTALSGCRTCSQVQSQVNQPASTARGLFRGRIKGGSSPCKGGSCGH